jgi:uncharacterized protein (DUF849 family)
MLVTAALNGARDPAEHAAIPVTPQELAREARAAVAMGAGALHLHVRDAAGVESLAAADLAADLAAVRSACPGTPVGISSGEWIVPDPALRCARAAEWTTLPDVVSVNFHERGAARLARLLLERGVAVEAGLDSGSAAEKLATSEVARSLALPDGRLAAGNGELVAAARRVVAEARGGFAGRKPGSHGARSCE